MKLREIYFSEVFTIRYIYKVLSRILTFFYSDTQATSYYPEKIRKSTTTSKQKTNGIEKDEYSVSSLIGVLDNSTFQIFPVKEQQAITPKSNNSNYRSKRSRNYMQKQGFGNKKSLNGGGANTLLSATTNAKTMTKKHY